MKVWFQVNKLLIYFLVGWLVGELVGRLVFGTL